MRDQDEKLVKLNTRSFGEIFVRNRLEDFEVVNTVFCFHAYDVRRLGSFSGTVIDLGANIGISARYFLQFLPKAKVIAVEPSNKNCSIFEMNIGLRPDRDKVRLLQCAIGSKRGRGYLVADEAERYDSFTVAAFKPDFEKGEPIEIAALSDLLVDVREPVILKIDIEGAEDELLGARLSWSHSVVRIMVEFHSPVFESRWCLNE
jgi:FkbM family methyltransferase